MKIEERLERIERLLVITAKSVWSVKDLALVLDRSESHIYTLCSQKKIPHYKQGGTTWFRRGEIEAWQCQTRIATDEELRREAVNHVTINRIAN